MVKILHFAFFKRHNEKFFKCSVYERKMNLFKLAEHKKVQKNILFTLKGKRETPFFRNLNFLFFGRDNPQKHFIFILFFPFFLKIRIIMHFLISLKTNKFLHFFGYSHFAGFKIGQRVSKSGVRDPIKTTGQLFQKRNTY